MIKTIIEAKMIPYSLRNGISNKIADRYASENSTK